MLLTAAVLDELAAAEPSGVGLVLRGSARQLGSVCSQVSLQASDVPPRVTPVRPVGAGLQRGMC